MPTPRSLPRSAASAAPLLHGAVADELEREVEHRGVVAGVVDAAVRGLVRHVLGADVVPLPHLDRVEAELAGDDVDDALGEPQMLHARVAAVRRDGRLVRRDLREVELDVAPAVHPRRDLRPDHAAEGLVPQPGAGVVERLGPESEQCPVVLDGHLGVAEPALVAVRHREVEVGAPLRPLHRPVELAREQAADDELRVRRDLVAETAADVLGDEAELVEPHLHRRAHHDRREPRELVVRVDRPLPDAAIELDERTVALERGRVEAVEVELGDLHDPVGLGEGGVEVAPRVEARPHEVPAGIVVQHGRVGILRLPCVDHRRQRLVVDLDELRRVARELPRLGDDGDDRLADVAHLADRERVVLDVGARHARDLEERLGEGRDLLAGQRPVDAVERLGRRDVDARDVRVRVRAAHEVEIAHPVPLDVVDEDALALQEALVLLARDALAAPTLLHLDGCGSERRLARSIAGSVEPTHLRPTSRPRRCSSTRCSGRCCPAAPS